MKFSKAAILGGVILLGACSQMDVQDDFKAQNRDDFTTRVTYPADQQQPKTSNSVNSRNENKVIQRNIIQAVKQINEAQNVHVIVSNHMIILGVHSSVHPSSHPDLEQLIKRTVNPLAEGRRIVILTDEGKVRELEKLEDNMLNGNRKSPSQQDLDQITDPI